LAARRRSHPDAKHNLERAGWVTDTMPPPVLPAGAVTTASTGAGSGSQGRTTGSVPGTETVTYAGSGLVFVNTYGSGVTAAFRSEIIAAENFYQSHYLNSCTISCSFNLESLSPAYGGENSFDPFVASYAQLRSALQSHATTADQLAAAAALNKLADPSGGKSRAPASTTP
jgi:hypothetical protein